MSIKPLAGLQIACAESGSQPFDVQPPKGKFWTRQSLHEWLENHVKSQPGCLIGIDLGLGFPLAYHEKFGLCGDYSEFLSDFHHHWPANRPDVTVESLRHGNPRLGDPAWMRLTDRWTSSATSVFRMQGQGCVGKSTHAGLPWLAQLRANMGRRLHFWPFDGWTPEPGVSVIVEVYPSLWSRRLPRESRNSHEQDAYVVASWLQRSASNGMLTQFFNPPLTPEEKAQAKVEGWILGVL